MLKMMTVKMVMLDLLPSPLLAIYCHPLRINTFDVNCHPFKTCFSSGFKWYVAKYEASAKAEYYEVVIKNDDRCGNITLSSDKITC